MLMKGCFLTPCQLQSTMQLRVQGATIAPLSFRGETYTLTVVRKEADSSNKYRRHSGRQAPRCDLVKLLGSALKDYWAEAIVPRLGQTLDAGAVLAVGDAQLPRFARPRFVQFVAELPKTASGKVQRAALRKAGTASAFDREKNARR